MKAEQSETGGNPRVPRKVRQRRHTREVRQPAFFKAYIQVGTVSGACKAIKLDRSLFYKWKEKDPTFMERLREAEEVLIERLEQKAIERALVDDSDSVLMFMLKKRKPGVYGDTQPKYVGNMPVPQQQTTFNVANIKLSELSDEGLDLVERMVKGFIASLDERDRLAAQAQLPVLDVPKDEEKKV